MGCKIMYNKLCVTSINLWNKVWGGLYKGRLSVNCHHTKKQT